MIKTFINGVQLPVNPFEDLTFSASVANKDYEVVALGEVTQIGNRKLINVDIKSLFTDKGYSFRVVERPKKAIEYVNMMYELLNAKKPIRFVVTGDETDINMLCSITGFKHSQKFGEEGEYYYSLELKEYREYQAKKVVVMQKPKVLLASASSKPIAKAIPQRVEKKPEQKTHTVRKGDTLWGISKKYYGNGSKWTKIYDANKDKIKNPNLIYPNQVFVIP